MLLIIAISMIMMMMMVMVMMVVVVMTGWWFQTFLFSIIYGIILPIDFHIFQGGWNHQKTERLTRGWYRLVRAAPTDSVGTISLEVSKVMVALKPRKVVEHFHANQWTSFVGHQPSRTSNLRPGFPGSYIPYSISGVITKRHNWHFGIGPWFRKLPVTEVVQLAIL